MESRRSHTSLLPRCCPSLPWSSSTCMLPPCSWPSPVRSIDVDLNHPTTSPRLESDAAAASRSYPDHSVNMGIHREHPQQAAAFKNTIGTGRVSSYTICSSNWLWETGSFHLWPQSIMNTATPQVCPLCMRHLHPHHLNPMTPTPTTYIP